MFPTTTERTATCDVCCSTDEFTTQTESGNTCEKCLNEFFPELAVEIAENDHARMLNKSHLKEAA